METIADFLIFRLSFKSYLSELSAQLPIGMLEQIREYILQNLAEIKFTDGNGKSTTAFGSTSFGNMGYVTIEKHIIHMLDKPNCKEQELINDYPDFNLVVDGRHIEKTGIILAIEYQRKCFVNIDTVRRGLEKYFNQKIGKLFSVEVVLRQLSSSDKFWKHLEDKVSDGEYLEGLRLEVSKLDTAELLDGQTSERAVFFGTLLNMLADLGAENGQLAFKAHKSSVLDLERAKYNLGMMIALSCKRGFVVKAKMKNKRGWIRSDETAPISFPLDRSVVLKPDDQDEQKEQIIEQQFHTLTQWFDKIYEELDKIEKEKIDEQTRRIRER